MHLPTIRALLGLALLAAAPLAAAGDDVYQWKDARGVTHYSQTPPSGVQYSAHREDGRDPVLPPANAKADAGTSQCDVARRNIAMLEGRDAVQQDTDGDGKPDKMLSDEDRANQLQLARAMLKANCPAATAPGH